MPDGGRYGWLGRGSRLRARLRGKLDQGFENAGALGGIGNEVAMAAGGVGLEAGLAFGVDVDDAGFGEGEIAVVGPDGVENRGEVPGGTVVGHLFVGAVAVDDGVVVFVAEVIFDGCGGEQEGRADFPTAANDGSGPLAEDFLCGGDVDAHVVFRLAVGELAGHHAEKTDFTADEVDCAGFVEEPCEIGAEAYLDDGHGAIRLLFEQGTQQRDGVEGIDAIAEAAGIERLAIGGLAIGGDAGKGRFLWGFALFHDAHGDIRAAVEVVDQIDVDGGVGIVFGEGDADQLGFAPRFERMDDGEGERVVDVVSHVGVEDEGNGRCAEEGNGVQSGQRKKSHQ